MLDPHGIYGTRSAYRVRVARRRRATQTILVGLSLLSLVVAVFVYMRMPRVRTITSSGQNNLMTALVTLPATAKSGNQNVLLVPTESGNLLAIDAQERKVRQSFATAFPLRAQPLVVQDTAFVPCQDGALYAVAWRTGQLLWSRKTASAMTTRPAYARVLLPQAAPSPTPAVAGTNQGTTQGGTSGVVPQQTPQAGVRGDGQPDASGGAVAGSLPTGITTPDTPKPTPRPLIFAGNDEGVIMALEADTGRLVWKRHATGPIGDGITATEDMEGRSRVLVPLLGGVASRGGLWCLDGKTGVPLWKFPGDTKTFAAQYAPSVVALEDGNATTGRIFCVDDSGAVMCLDLKSSKKIWKTFAQPLPSAPPNTVVLLRAEPLLKLYSWGERLFVGGSDGGLRCYDAQNGRLQWVYNTGASIRCRPQTVRLERGGATQDVILTGCDDNAMYALEAQSGALLWKYRTSGPAFAGPLVADQQLLNVTADGRIQSFSLTP